MDNSDQFRILVLTDGVPGVVGGTKFGRNPDVSIGTTEDVWSPGGEMILPSVASTLSVVSSNAADTLTSGTGAWKVCIKGLDADYNQIEEIVDLNGVTPVNTTKEFLRVYRSFVEEVGTNERNVGTITTSHSGNTISQIEPGNGQSEQTNFTVPANHTMLIEDFHVSCGTNDAATVYFEIKEFGPNKPWRQTINGEFQEGISTAALQGTALKEKTDFRLRALALGANTSVRAFYDYKLVKEGAL